MAVILNTIMKIEFREFCMEILAGIRQLQIIFGHSPKIDKTEINHTKTSGAAYAGSPRCPAIAVSPRTATAYTALT